MLLRPLIVSLLLVSSSYAAPRLWDYDSEEAGGLDHDSLRRYLDKRYHWNQYFSSTNPPPVEVTTEAEVMDEGFDEEEGEEVNEYDEANTSTSSEGEIVNSPTSRTGGGWDWFFNPEPDTDETQTSPATTVSSSTEPSTPTAATSETESDESDESEVTGTTSPPCPTTAPSATTTDPTTASYPTTTWTPSSTSTATTPPPTTASYPTTTWTPSSTSTATNPPPTTASYPTTTWTPSSTSTATTPSPTTTWIPSSTPTTTTSDPSTTAEPETANTAETSPSSTTSTFTTTSELPELVSIIFARPGDDVDRPHLPPVSTLESNEIPRSPFYYNPFSMAGAQLAPHQPIEYAPIVRLVPQITYEVTPHVVWKPVVQVPPMPYAQYVPQLPAQSPFMQDPAVNYFGAQELPHFESHLQPQSYPISHIDPPMEIDGSISRRLAKTLMRNEEFANIFVDILSKELPREANLIELKEESLNNPEAITAALLQTFRKNEKFKQLLANAYAEVKGLDDKRDEFILRFVETLINDKGYEAELTNTFEEGLQSKWHDRFEKSFNQLTQEEKDKLISSWNY